MFDLNLMIRKIYVYIFNIQIESENNYYIQCLEVHKYLKLIFSKNWDIFTILDVSFSLFFENALLSILYGNTCNHFIYVLSLLDGTRLGDVQRRLIILPTLYLYLRTQLYKILYFLRKTYKDYCDVLNCS